MKKSFLAFLPFALIVLFLSACAAQPAASAAEPAAVSAEPALLIAEGRLVPANSLDQAFAAPGQVAEVLVQDGETVTDGQPLARLAGSPEAEAALSRAEQEVLAAGQALAALDTTAELDLAQAELDRLAAQEAFDDAQDRFDANDSDENKAKLDQAAAALALAEDTQKTLKSGSGVDPDLRTAAEARLAAAEAALLSAQAALDRLELKATLAGTVVDLNLQAGQWVTAAAPVLTLADLSAWVVETDNLTESEVVSVTTGQPVEVVLDALPGSPLSGEVSHINTRYEEKRGDITFTVTVALTETDPLMRWGMTAAVEFLP